MPDIVIGIIFVFIAFLASLFWLKLKNPGYILLAMSIISAPWQGGLWIEFMMLDLRFTYIFLIGAIILINSKRKKFTEKFHLLITIPSLAIFIWSLIASNGCLDYPLALGGSITLLLDFLTFYTVYNAITTEKDVRWVINALVFGLFITGGLAVLQYMIPLFHIGFIDGEFKTFMWWRTRSTFWHANNFGMYLLFLLPIIFRMVAITIQTKEKFLTKIYAIVFLLGGFSLITTENRGSWVGLFTGMVVSVVFDFLRMKNKKAKKVVLRVAFSILIVASLGGVRFGGKIYERFYGGYEDVDVQSKHREELNIIAYELMAQHPYTGVGFWNSRFYADVIFTHNVYLLITAEIGFVGVAFFGLQVLFFLIESIKAQRSKNFYTAQLGSGLLATLIGFLVASYPGPDYWIMPSVRHHLFILVAIIAALNLYDKKVKKMQSRSNPLSRPTSVNLGNSNMLAANGMVSN
jgi:hypothetical protein